MRKMMYRRWAVGGGLAGILLLSGCVDYKAKAALLDERNLALQGQLKDCEADRDAADEQVAELQNRTRGLEQEVRELGASQGVSQSKYDAAISAAASLRAELAKRGADADDWKSGTGIAMTEVSSDVLFAAGSAKITSKGQAALSRIVARLNGQYGDMDVMVLGHTDSDQINKSRKLWKDNWDLSAGRALAVARFLVSHGVQASRIVAAGAADHRRLSPNADKASKARNRRVEVFAYRQSVMK